MECCVKSGTEQCGNLKIRKRKGSMDSADEMIPGIILKARLKWMGAKCKGCHRRWGVGHGLSVQWRVMWRKESRSATLVSAPQHVACCPTGRVSGECTHAPLCLGESALQASLLGPVSAEGPVSIWNPERGRCRQDSQNAVLMCFSIQRQPRRSSSREHPSAQLCHLPCGP